MSTSRRRGTCQAGATGPDEPRKRKPWKGQDSKTEAEEDAEEKQKAEGSKDEVPEKGKAEGGGGTRNTRPKRKRT